MSAHISRSISDDPRLVQNLLQHLHSSKQTGASLEQHRRSWEATSQGLSQGSHSNSSTPHTAIGISRSHHRSGDNSGYTPLSISAQTSPKNVTSDTGQVSPTWSYEYVDPEEDMLCVTQEAGSITMTQTHIIRHNEQRNPTSEIASACKYRNISMETPVSGVSHVTTTTTTSVSYVTSSGSQGSYSGSGVLTRNSDPTSWVQSSHPKPESSRHSYPEMNIPVDSQILCGSRTRNSDQSIDSVYDHVYEEPASMFSPDSVTDIHVYSGSDSLTRSQSASSGTYASLPCRAKPIPKSSSSPSQFKAAKMSIPQDPGSPGDYSTHTARKMQQLDSLGSRQLPETPSGYGSLRHTDATSCIRQRHLPDVPFGVDFIRQDISGFKPALDNSGTLVSKKKSRSNVVTPTLKDETPKLKYAEVKPIKTNKSPKTGLFQSKFGMIFQRKNKDPKVSESQKQPKPVVDCDKKSQLTQSKDVSGSRKDLRSPANVSRPGKGASPTHKPTSPVSKTPQMRPFSPTHSSDVMDREPKLTTSNSVNMVKPKGKIGYKVHDPETPEPRSKMDSSVSGPLKQPGIHSRSESPPAQKTKRNTQGFSRLRHPSGSGNTVEGLKLKPRPSPIPMSNINRDYMMRREESVSPRNKSPGVALGSKNIPKKNLPAPKGIPRSKSRPTSVSSTPPSTPTRLKSPEVIGERSAFDIRSATPMSRQSSSDKGQRSRSNSGQQQGSNPPRDMAQCKYQRLPGQEEHSHSRRNSQEKSPIHKTPPARLLPKGDSKGQYAKLLQTSMYSGSKSAQITSSGGEAMSSPKTEEPQYYGVAENGVKIKYGKVRTMRTLAQDTKDIGSAEPAKVKPMVIESSCITDNRKSVHNVINVTGMPGGATPRTPVPKVKVAAGTQTEPSLLPRGARPQRSKARDGLVGLGVRAGVTDSVNTDKASNPISPIESQNKGALISGSNDRQRQEGNKDRIASALSTRLTPVSDMQSPVPQKSEERDVRMCSPPPVLTSTSNQAHSPAISPVSMVDTRQPRLVRPYASLSRTRPLFGKFGFGATRQSHAPGAHTIPEEVCPSGLPRQQIGADEDVSLMTTDNNDGQEGKTTPCDKLEGHKSTTRSVTPVSVYNHGNNEPPDNEGNKNKSDPASPLGNTAARGEPSEGENEIPMDSDDNIGQALSPTEPIDKVSNVTSKVTEGQSDNNNRSHHNKQCVIEVLIDDGVIQNTNVASCSDKLHNNKLELDQIEVEKLPCVDSNDDSGCFEQGEGHPADVTDVNIVSDLHTSGTETETASSVVGGESDIKERALEGGVLSVNNNGCVNSESINLRDPSDEPVGINSDNDPSYGRSSHQTEPGSAKTTPGDKSACSPVSQDDVLPAIMSTVRVEETPSMTSSHQGREISSGVIRDPAEGRRATRDQTVIGTISMNNAGDSSAVNVTNHHIMLTVGKQRCVPIDDLVTGTDMYMELTINTTPKQEINTIGSLSDQVYGVNDIDLVSQKGLDDSAGDLWRDNNNLDSTPGDSEAPNQKVKLPESPTPHITDSPNISPKENIDLTDRIIESNRTNDDSDNSSPKSRGPAPGDITCHFALQDSMTLPSSFLCSTFPDSWPSMPDMRPLTKSQMPILDPVQYGSLDRRKVLPPGRRYCDILPSVCSDEGTLADSDSSETGASHEIWEAFHSGLTQGGATGNETVFGNLRLSESGYDSWKSHDSGSTIQMGKDPRIMGFSNNVIQEGPKEPIEPGGQSYDVQSEGSTPRDKDSDGTTTVSTMSLASQPENSTSHEPGQSRSSRSGSKSSVTSQDSLPDVQDRPYPVPAPRVILKIPDTCEPKRLVKLDSMDSPVKITDKCEPKRLVKLDSMDSPVKAFTRDLDLVTSVITPGTPSNVSSDGSPSVEHQDSSGYGKTARPTNEQCGAKSRDNLLLPRKLRLPEPMSRSVGSDSSIGVNRQKAKISGVAIGTDNEITDDKKIAKTALNGDGKAACVCDMGGSDGLVCELTAQKEQFMEIDNVQSPESKGDSDETITPGSENISLEFTGIEIEIEDIDEFGCCVVASGEDGLLTGTHPDLAPEQALGDDVGSHQENIETLTTDPGNRWPLGADVSMENAACGCFVPGNNRNIVGGGDICRNPQGTASGAKQTGSGVGNVTKQRDSSAGSHSRDMAKTNGTNIVHDGALDVDCDIKVDGDLAPRDPTSHTQSDCGRTVAARAHSEPISGLNNVPTVKPGYREKTIAPNHSPGCDVSMSSGEGKNGEAPGTLQVSEVGDGWNRTECSTLLTGDNEGGAECGNLASLLASSPGEVTSMSGVTKEAVSRGDKMPSDRGHSQGVREVLQPGGGVCDNGCPGNIKPLSTVDTETINLLTVPNLDNPDATRYDCSNRATTLMHEAHNQMGNVQGPCYNKPNQFPGPSLSKCTHRTNDKDKEEKPTNYGHGDRKPVPTPRGKKSAHHKVDPYMTYAMEYEDSLETSDSRSMTPSPSPSSAVSQSSSANCSFDSLEGPSSPIDGSHRNQRPSGLDFSAGGQKPSIQGHSILPVLNVNNMLLQPKMESPTRCNSSPMLSDKSEASVNSSAANSGTTFLTGESGLKRFRASSHLNIRNGNEVPSGDDKNLLLKETAVSETSLHTHILSEQHISPPEAAEQPQQCPSTGVNGQGQSSNQEQSVSAPVILTRFGRKPRNIPMLQVNTNNSEENSQSNIVSAQTQSNYSRSRSNQMSKSIPSPTRVLSNSTSPTRDYTMSTSPTRTRAQSGPKINPGIPRPAIPRSKITPPGGHSSLQKGLQSIMSPDTPRSRLQGQSPKSRSSSPKKEGQGATPVQSGDSVNPGSRLRRPVTKRQVSSPGDIGNYGNNVETPGINSSYHSNIQQRSVTKMSSGCSTERNRSDMSRSNGSRSDMSRSFTSLVTKFESPSPTSGLPRSRLHKQSGNQASSTRNKRHSAESVPMNNDKSRNTTRASSEPKESPGHRQNSGYQGLTRNVSSRIGTKQSASPRVQGQGHRFQDIQDSDVLVRNTPPMGCEPITTNLDISNQPITAHDSSEVVTKAQDSSNRPISSQDDGNELCMDSSTEGITEGSTSRGSKRIPQSGMKRSEKQSRLPSAKQVGHASLLQTVKHVLRDIRTSSITK